MSLTVNLPAFVPHAMALAVETLAHPGSLDMAVIGIYFVTLLGIGFCLMADWEMKRPPSKNGSPASTDRAEHLSYPNHLQGVAAGAR